MSEEDEQRYRKANICRFCEKETFLDKVRDRCHLARKNRGPALSNCNINVIQKQSFFEPFLFPKFSNYDCHLFFKN